MLRTFQSSIFLVVSLWKEEGRRKGDKDKMKHKKPWEIVAERYKNRRENCGDCAFNCEECPFSEELGEEK